MKVLVTRPGDDAEKTAAELQARGHQAVVAPLMEIRFSEGPEIALTDVQAILATSANGVRALARRSARRDVPVLAVGPQTAEAARAAGFTSVTSSDGDAAALAEATCRWHRPEAGVLFHPSGAQTKGELAEKLAAAGFAVRREILYEARPVRELPMAAAAALHSGTLDAVLLFSPRSARIFVHAVQRANLDAACRRILALCISPTTASALGLLAFAEVRVATRPDQAGMLALVG